MGQEVLGGRLLSPERWKAHQVLGEPDLFVKTGLDGRHDLIVVHLGHDPSPAEFQRTLGGKPTPGKLTQP